MYRLILVPLDGSGFSESALPPALSISRRTGAKLHLAMAVEPSPTLLPVGWTETLQEKVGSYLAHLREEVSEFAGGTVTTRVLHGPPAEAIEEEAERSGADLLVMASHGRGPLTRAWLGSVTDAVTRHGTRPILVVRPEEDASTSLETDWRISKLMVPLDGTPTAEAVLDHAVETGALFEASLHLVRVIPFPMVFSSSYMPDLIGINHEFVEKAREAAEAYLGGKAEALRTRGLSVDTSVVVVPQPAHGILAEAEVSGCDFLAMGTHGRGSLARAVLGSTADKVLRSTHTPLLLFRKHS